MAAYEWVSQRQRAEFQEVMKQTRERKRIAHELEAEKARLRKTKQEHKKALAVVTAKGAIRTYDPVSLGKGKKKGGGEQYRKERFGVLERVRLLAELSPEQRNDWDYFKGAWDRHMAEAHGEDWADIFCEHIQHVLNELGAGKANALSVFMHQETVRVLCPTPALQVPGLCGH